MTQKNRSLTLRPLTKSPITREQLKKYAVASTDPNQIHLDDSVAQAVGLKGVIAHGMLTMAFMGEFLYQAIADHSANQGSIAEFSCRFKAMTYPGDIITISGNVVNTPNNPANATATLYKIELEATNQNGETTAVGSATLNLK